MANVSQEFIDRLQSQIDYFKRYGDETGLPTKQADGATIGDNDTQVG